MLVSLATTSVGKPVRLILLPPLVVSLLVVSLLHCSPYHWQFRTRYHSVSSREMVFPLVVPLVDAVLVVTVLVDSALVDSVLVVSVLIVPLLVAPVLSAEPESVLMDDGVASLATVGVGPDPAVGTTPARAVVPHRQVAAGPDFAALRMAVSPSVAFW